MGTSLHYMGEAGNGQHCKACNQIAVAGAVAAMSEAIVYAKAQGLEVEICTRCHTKRCGWKLADGSYSTKSFKQ